MDDYRVRVGFLDHPKTLRAKRLLGQQAIEIALRLWEFACANPPRRDGNLHGLDAGDIAGICRYDGDPVEFADLLSEKIGWLDATDGGYQIHDWRDANPYVAGWRGRSAKAKQAAASRWGGTPKTKTTKKKTKKKTTGKKKAPAKKKAAPKPKPQTPAQQIHAVFDHYRTYHPTAQRKPSPTSLEWRRARDRLVEGFTVEELCAAIDGCHRSPFHMGENRDRKRFNTLDLILRDASHVQQFIEVPQDQTKQIRGQFADTTRQLAMWAEEGDNQDGDQDGDQQEGSCVAHDQAAGLLPEPG